MTSYCPHCGTPGPAEARFCVKCGGERMPVPPTTPPAPPPPAAPPGALPEGAPPGALPEGAPPGAPPV
ncbi:zinc-ribbon domain-containing protein, partial [Streptomyces caniscabiei]|uniref:zinc-ribbon domain-containing protein n=1 Tax=Streptomyces caniscabiei TaxID=2746961 RepID=UPI0038D478BC